MKGIAAEAVGSIMVACNSDNVSFATQPANIILQRSKYPFTLLLITPRPEDVNRQILPVRPRILQRAQRLGSWRKMNSGGNSLQLLSGCEARQLLELPARYGVILRKTRQGYPLFCSLFFDRLPRFESLLNIFKVIYVPQV